MSATRCVKVCRACPLPRSGLHCDGVLGEGGGGTVATEKPAAAAPEGPKAVGAKARGAKPSAAEEEKGAEAV